jgi:hypothetical protein
MKNFTGWLFSLVYPNVDSRDLKTLEKYNFDKIHEKKIKILCKRAN